MPLTQEQKLQLANLKVQKGILDVFLGHIKGDKGDIPKHEWDGTKLSFELPDGTFSAPIDLKGNTGDTGDKGEKGDQGVPGQDGKDGQFTAKEKKALIKEIQTYFLTDIAFLEDENDKRKVEIQDANEKFEQAIKEVLEQVNSIEIPEFDKEAIKSDILNAMPKYPNQNAGGSGATFLKSMRDFDIPREKDRTDGYSITWNAAKRKFDLQEGGGAGTLAEVSAGSTDTASSLYTMTSGVDVEFEDSSNNTMIYLDESTGRRGFGTDSPSAYNHFEVNNNDSSMMMRISNQHAGGRAGFVFNLPNNTNQSYAFGVQNDRSFYITEGATLGGSKTLFKFTPSATVGIGGDFTPGGKVHIKGTSASTAVGVFQGASSQTANLTEWQTNAGTAVAYVDENGGALVDTLNIANIPTSASGLSSGDVWSDSGTLKIA